MAAQREPDRKVPTGSSAPKAMTGAPVKGPGRRKIDLAQYRIGGCRQTTHDRYPSVARRHPGGEREKSRQWRNFMSPAQQAFVLTRRVARSLVRCHCRDLVRRQAATQLLREALVSASVVGMQHRFARVRARRRAQWRSPSDDRPPRNVTAAPDIFRRGAANAREVPSDGADAGTFGVQCATGERRSGIVLVVQRAGRFLSDDDATAPSCSPW